MTAKEPGQRLFEVTTEGATPERWKNLLPHWKQRCANRETALLIQFKQCPECKGERWIASDVERHSDGGTVYECPACDGRGMVPREGK